jgi:hypothetical protein
MKLTPMLAGLAFSRHVWSWSVTAIPLNSWSESDQEAIRQQLDRILRSGPFHQSRRRQRFLEYLVNETLAGRGERLKGYNVALEVFDRPESFDPVTDPLVRIEAARLREKLREYYGEPPAECSSDVDSALAMRFSSDDSLRNPLASVA